MKDQSPERMRRRGRPPKFDKILDALRADILSGKYQPGDRLPTRERLATLFGSTKVTMQKAMDVLLEEGIISARRGAGTYVTDQADSKLPYFLIVNKPAGVLRFKDALVREAKERTGDRQALSVCIYQGEHYTSDELERLYDLITRQRVAGLLFAAPYTAVSGSPLVQANNIPKVYIGTNNPGPNAPCVTFEGRAAILNHVLDYYKKEGRKSAAMMHGIAYNIPLTESPFRQLAADRGIEVPTEWEFGGSVASSVDTERLTRLLFRNPLDRPSALHIADDNIVPAVTAALTEMKIRVPEDVLVTAHANFPYPTSCHIAARRIGYDVREFIDRGLEALNTKRKGETPSDSVVRAIWEEEVKSSV